MADSQAAATYPSLRHKLGLSCAIISCAKWSPSLVTLPGKFVSCRRLRCASFIYSTGLLTEYSPDACCLKTAQPAKDDFIHRRSGQVWKRSKLQLCP